MNSQSMPYTDYKTTFTYNHGIQYHKRELLHNTVHRGTVRSRTHLKYHKNRETRINILSHDTPLKG